MDLHSDEEGILLDTSYFVEMLCTNMRYNAQNLVGIYAEIQILFKFWIGPLLFVFHPIYYFMNQHIYWYQYDVVSKIFCLCLLKGFLKRICCSKKPHICSNCVKSCFIWTWLKVTPSRGNFAHPLFFSITSQFMEIVISSRTCFIVGQ